MAEKSRFWTYLFFSAPKTVKMSITALGNMEPRIHQDKDVLCLYGPVHTTRSQALFKLHKFETVFQSKSMRSFLCANPTQRNGLHASAVFNFIEMCAEGNKAAACN